MKKLICVLTAAVLMISQAVVSYADNLNPVYAPESVRDDMKTNLYDDSDAYVFLFGTSNVRFDFDSAMPIYAIKRGSGVYISEMIFFTERYAVPVYDSKSDTFFGFAAFGKIAAYDDLPPILKEHEYSVEQSLNHAGEWELKRFGQTKYQDNLLYCIENTDISADKVYYIEDEAYGNYGLLYVSKSKDGSVSERFLDVSETDGAPVFYTGEELLNKNSGGAYRPDDEPELSAETDESENIIQLVKSKLIKILEKYLLI